MSSTNELGDELRGLRMSASIRNRVNVAVKHQETGRVRHKDKADRATRQLVLDPRTEKMLLRIMNRGYMTQMHGCVSTGKEANVYHAVRRSEEVAHRGNEEVKEEDDEVNESSTVDTKETEFDQNNGDEKEPEGNEEKLSSLRSDGLVSSPYSEGKMSSSGGLELSGKHEELAVKIFKTSILVFKDRERYVAGEHRFRHGYCKSNNRKMVSTWAEKEFRNLKRLEAAGIPAPTPLHLDNHVLVMSFVGQAGAAGPRLKDVELSEKRWRELYLQIVVNMHELYHKCCLVHADLSEYNLLYWKKQAYFIDVSQSVEHDHPNARRFLVKDCENITKFFRSRGLVPMRASELFNFVTNAELETTEQIHEYLNTVQKDIASRAVVSEQWHTSTLTGERAIQVTKKDVISNDDQIQESIFLQSDLPSNLDELDMLDAEHLLTRGARNEHLAQVVKSLTSEQPADEGKEGGEEPMSDDEKNALSDEYSDDSSSSDSDPEVLPGVRRSQMEELRHCKNMRNTDKKALREMRKNMKKAVKAAQKKQREAKKKVMNKKQKAKRIKQSRKR